MEIDEYRQQNCRIEIYDNDCKIIILDAIPSYHIFESKEHYPEKGNRFWEIISSICGVEKIPESYESKISLLLTNHIALYDVVDPYMKRKSDNALSMAVIDFEFLIRDNKNIAIFCNGKTAYNAFNREHKYALPATYLPSTSAANTRYSTQQLKEIWSETLVPILRP